VPENQEKKKGRFSGNRFSRRTFLKRTGGATAATMLAMHGMKVEVLAQGTSTQKNTLHWFFSKFVAQHTVFSATDKNDAIVQALTQPLPDPQVWVMDGVLHTPVKVSLAPSPWNSDDPKGSVNDANYNGTLGVWEVTITWKKYNWAITEGYISPPPALP